LHRLGARTVPVVAKGDKWTFAQSFGDVAELLDLEYDVTPQLSPDQLVAKMDLVLTAAQRFVRQFPAETLDKDVRNRKRSHRDLFYHIFRIPEAFLEVTIGDGAKLYRDDMNMPAPAEVQTVEQITEYGEGVRKRVLEWWQNTDDRTLTRQVPTYYGDQPLHHLLERLTWHPTQHVRQLMALLADMGIDPDGPLTPDDLAGLPLPEKAWDDE